MGCCIGCGRRLNQEENPEPEKDNEEKPHLLANDS